jgi:hypothetical protein
VGTSDVSPQAKAPVVGAYDVCATVSDRLAAGETRTLACHATAQYVIVQLKGNDYLTLCEVRVEGRTYSLVGDFNIIRALLDVYNSCL